MLVAEHVVEVEASVGAADLAGGVGLCGCGRVGQGMQIISRIVSIVRLTELTVLTIFCIPRDAW